MKRTVRFVGLAVMAAAAFSAFAASPAFAAHSGNQWVVDGTALGNGEFETVTPSLMSAKAALTSKVQNQSFKLTATGLKCGVLSLCQIKQVIEGEAAHAKIEGKLTFTGVSIDEPTGCSVATEITTTELVAEVITVTGTAYVKFSPKSGTTLANITITGCAVAETYPVKGSVCAETWSLGTETALQRAAFSEFINNRSCGPGSLKVGAEPAVITGEATYRLPGELSWGAKAF